MKLKPLIKYRSTNKCARYIVVDPQCRTYMTAVIFKPNGIVKTFNLWGAGPVRRFDDLQLAIACAVAMLERDIIRRAALAPVALPPAE